MSRSEDEKEARAHYNFIPLSKGDPIEGDHVIVDDKKRPIPHDCYNPERHTGYFDVQMKTETPLFVRGMLTAEEVKQGIESRNKETPMCANLRKELFYLALTKQR